MTQPTAWRRARRQLSAETKWEIFLQVTAGEISQADAARRWQVDVSTIIGIRRTVKDAALAVLARKPGRPAREGDWQLEAARTRSTNSPRRSRRRPSSWRWCGESKLGLAGPLPARVPAEVKETILKMVDDAVAAGAPHTWVTGLLGVSDDRVHRWRARLHDVGTLVDRAPGGVALHALMPFEEQAILDLVEDWGPVDRSHRKLAHRGSYLGLVWVSPSTVRRVLAGHGLVLPAAPRRAPVPRAPWPTWLHWQPNRAWAWE